MAGYPGSIRLCLYSYDGLTQYDVIWPCTTVKIENNRLYYDGLEGYVEDEPDIDVQGSISGFALTANGQLVCSNNETYDISELSYDAILYVKTATTYKHLTLVDGTKIQVESAIRDEYGNRIDTVYALKTDLSDISYEDVSIEEQDSSAFVVTITFSESEIPDKQAVYVYDGTDTSGTLVFSDTNSRTATPPATVSCSTGYLYIRCVGTAQWINDTIRDVTGSITSAYAGPGEGGPILITVNSSGSFTMSVDYDF